MAEGCQRVLVRSSTVTPDRNGYPAGMETDEAPDDGDGRPRPDAPSELRDQRFHDLFDAAGVGIASADLDGRFIEANPACLDMLGYTLGEFCQQDLTPVTHPDDRSASRDDRGAPVHLGIMVTDVTEIHVTKGEALQAIRNHAATLESVTDAVLTVDRDWRITFLNERAEHLLRRDRHEILGESLGESLWEVFPEAVDTPLYEAYRAAVRYGRTVETREEYVPPWTPGCP